MPHFVEGLVFGDQKFSCDRVQSVLLKEWLDLPSTVKEIIFTTLLIIVFSREYSNLLILDIDDFNNLSHPLLHCLDHLW